MKECPETDGKALYLCNSICINNACISNPIREKVGGAAALQEEPLVLPHVLHRRPLHRVGLQHVAQQRHHALVQVVRDGEHPTLDLPELRFEANLIRPKLT